MNEYMIGCNYWGSKYGTDMWKYWDEESVRNDVKLLAEYGVTHMRVFPNWRDFQPIQSLKGHRGSIHEYRFADDVELDNEYGLDMKSIEHFEKFCDFCGEYGIKLVVSIITGWMSGRLFTPPAVEGKNHISDPESLYWQGQFAKGFVKHLKHRKEILYWDLGNECNNLSPVATRPEAQLWTQHIRDAILSEDHSRKIMSGMHYLSLDGGFSKWTVPDQANLTDVLTPHPYPSPSVGGDIEPMNRLRTTLIPTAQTAIYSGIGHKPAMMQETGAFSDTLGSPKRAADFMRVNIWSGWANGSLGYLWWCAHEQRQLKFPPYQWSMVENELGLFHCDYTPKEVAKTMKHVSKVINTMPFGNLPPRIIEAVCIVPDELRQPYFFTLSAAYVLAKQAGIEITYSYHKDKLPESDLYIIPSLAGWAPLTTTLMNELMEACRNGATVLVSNNDGVMTDFHALTGLEVDGGIYEAPGTKTADFGDFKVPFSYGKQHILKAITAEVLAKDEDGNIVMSVNKYGKGKFYYLDFPLEQYTWYKTNTFADDYYKIYQIVGKDIIEKKIANSKTSDIGVTVHPKDDKTAIVVAINYSDKPLACDVTFADGYTAKTIYGDNKTIPSCDAVVFEITKK